MCGIDFGNRLNGITPTLTSIATIKKSKQTGSHTTLKYTSLTLKIGTLIRFRGSCSAEKQTRSSLRHARTIPNWRNYD